MDALTDEVGVWSPPGFETAATAAARPTKPPRPHRPRQRSLGVAALLALLMVAVAGGPSSWAVFSGVTGSPANSFATGTFDCPSRAGLPAASLYYSYMPAAGAAEPDLSGSGSTGTLGGGVTRQVGACSPPNTSPHVTVSAGQQAGYVVSQNRLSAPGEYSVSLWFKPTVAGGMLADFGDTANSGGSTKTDRQIYYRSDGSLAFGQLLSGVPMGCSIPGPIATGSWHLVVATFDPGALGGAAARMYLDGSATSCASLNLVGLPSSTSGFWRFGGDNLSSSTWLSASSTGYFTGALDETAIYPRELTATEVDAIYAAGH